MIREDSENFLSIVTANIFGFMWNIRYIVNMLFCHYYMDHDQNMLLASRCKEINHMVTFFIH